jgi:hypothetical protein
VPHSTQVAGYAVIYGADDRYIANIFLGGDLDRAYAPGSRLHTGAGHARTGFGLGVYEGHPTTFAEYLDRIRAQPPGDLDRYPGVKQPLYSRSNLYAAGARPSDADQHPLVLDGDAAVEVVEEGDGVYLHTQLPQNFDQARTPVITGHDLERVRFVDADYEQRDGTPLIIGTDLTGERKEHGDNYPAGPLTALQPGTGRIRVW